MLVILSIFLHVSSLHSPLSGDTGVCAFGEVCPAGTRYLHGNSITIRSDLRETCSGGHGSYQRGEGGAGTLCWCGELLACTLLSSSIFITITIIDNFIEIC